MLNQKAVLMQQLVTILTQLIALEQAGENTSTSISEPIVQQPTEMLTIPEVMALGTGVSEHTLRKLIAQ